MEHGHVNKPVRTSDNKFAQSHETFYENGSINYEKTKKKEAKYGH